MELLERKFQGKKKLELLQIIEKWNLGPKKKSKGWKCGVKTRFFENQFFKSKHRDGWEKKARELYEWPTINLLPPT